MPTFYPKSRHTSLVTFFASAWSFFPHVSNPIAKPPCRHYLLLRVKLHAFFPLNMEVAVERFVPPGEGEHGHGRGHADVNPNHAGFDPMPELARGFSGLS